MPPNDLLHNALKRHASQAGEGEPLQLPAMQHLSMSDDDDEVEVRTPAPSTPASTASTPAGSRSSSRASSPSRKGKSGAGKPRRDKTKEREKAEANKNPLDPLVRFPGEVTGRILGELGMHDLLACGLVCKRWRRSQTLNYTWYLLLQSLTYVEPSKRRTAYSETNGLPTWLKSEAKEDWAARFANIYRRDDIESHESDHDENGLTMKEERELKWKEENEQAEALFADKNEMRQYYKSLGNSKIKGKRGKGGIRTIEGDGIGDGVDDGV
ncbi:hypothetical protein OIV83_003196 [Microbotryomycetes sp. JL201]|nr:hypothetical protein OIV83_003196 [Microbotryomycetes sp. JL201]